MKKLLVAAFAAAFAAVQTFAAELPAAVSGVVTLAANETYTLTEASDLAGITKIAVTQGATLVYDVAEGATLTIPCAVNGKGNVIKNGKGTAKYTYIAAGKDLNSYNIDYPGYTTVNDGTLKLPDYTGNSNYTYSGVEFGRMVVKAPGVLDVTTASICNVCGLWGDGEVTAGAGSLNQLQIQTDKGKAGETYFAPSKFSGKLTGTIRFRPAGKADILSTESTCNGDTVFANNCDIGIMKFGNLNAAGSFGTKTVSLGGATVKIRYLGEGEETTKGIWFASNSKDVTLDGGATGGLVISGGVGGAAIGKEASITFTGNNATACKVNGNISDVSGNKVNVIKQGSGTWEFNGNTPFTGLLTVEAGTLKVGKAFSHAAKLVGGTFAVADGVSAELALAEIGGANLAVGTGASLTLASTDATVWGGEVTAESAGTLKLTGKVKIATASTFKRTTLVSVSSGSVDASGCEFDLPTGCSAEIKGDSIVIINENGADIDPDDYVMLTVDDPTVMGKDVNLYSYHLAGGWSDGKMPTADKDYFVDAGRIINFNNQGAPAISNEVAHGKSEGNYWQKIHFYGKSLTLAGTAYHTCASPSGGYALAIKDWRVLSGAKLDMQVSGNKITMFNFFNNDGDVLTVQAAAARPFVIDANGDAAHQTYFWNKLVGAAGAGISLVGGKTYFFGDNTDYLGTVVVGANSKLGVSNGFGGIIDLAGSGSSFVLASAVQNGNDAIVTEASSGALKLGGLKMAGDFAWNAADAGFDVGYMNIGGKFTLTGAKAVFPVGGWQLGSLEFANAVTFDCIDLGNAGVNGGIVVDGAVTLGGKVKFDFGYAPILAAKTRVFSVPASSGITEADIEVINCLGATEFVKEGDALVLYVKKTVDYVVLTKDDPEANGLDNNLYSYHLAGGWSDGLKPTEDKDYYVPAGRMINFNNNGAPAIASDTSRGKSSGNYWQQITFYGRSLTVAGTMINNSPSTNDGYAMKIPDWRVLPGAVLTASQSQSYQCGIDAKFDVKKQGCKLTVYANEANPFVIEGGKKPQTFHFYNNWYGSADACTRIIGSHYYGEQTANGAGCVQLLGDMSHYFGTIEVGPNTTLKLGSGFPGKLKFDSVNVNGFELVGAAGTNYEFNELVTAKAMDITVPAGSRFVVNGGASLAGTLNFVCTDFSTGKIRVMGAEAGQVKLNGAAINISNGYLYDKLPEGSGTKDDPYRIVDANQMALFADMPDAYVSLDASLFTAKTAITVREVPANAEVDLSKIIVPELANFDEFFFRTRIVGNLKTITLYNGVVPDRVAADREAMYSETSPYIYLYPNDSNTTGGDKNERQSSYAKQDWILGNWHHDGNYNTPTNLVPEANNDYVVFPSIWSKIGAVSMNLLGGDIGTFAGDSLTVCKYCQLRDDYRTTATINDMRWQSGSKLFVAGAGNNEQTFKGKWTILATADDPFLFSLQVADDHTYVCNLAADLVGSATRSIKVDNGQENFGTGKILFSGDCTRYFGTIDAGKGGLIGIASEFGMPNAKLVVPATAKGVIAGGSDEAQVAVKSLSIAAGKTIWVEGKGLVVTDSFTQEGVINLDLTNALIDGDTAVFTADHALDLADFNIIGKPRGYRVVAQGNSLVAVRKVGTMLLVK